MLESVTHLAERLRVEGEKSVAFFYNLPEAVWGITIYTDGANWTIHEILAHYASAEANLGLLIENILAGGSGAREDFDLNRFNRSQVDKLQVSSRPELLQNYQALRAENVARVERMLPADLERPGRHPYLGQTTLAEIIKMIYRHNQIHQREIRQVLSGMNFDPPTT